MAGVQVEALPSAEVKQEPAKVEGAPAAAPTEPQERQKPSLGTWTGIDWSKVPEDARDALQAEMDRRISAAKANERRRAKKETEAFYKGRESVRPSHTAPQQPEKEAENEAPKREDFAIYEDFLEAKSVYAAERAWVKAMDKSRREAQARTAQEKEDKRVAEFRSKVYAKYPDIDDRLTDIVDMPIHEGVQEAIAESEFGPEILNDLVSRPEEFERLIKLSESSAVREIGRMEARFEAATKPTEPVAKPASAPAPIKPGGGGASPEDGTPSDRDSIDDWMRKERARLRKKHA